jgi:uncharacterized protein (TIGR03437 family)
MKSHHIVLGLLLAAGAATAQQYTISTIAGIGGVQGYLGDGGSPLLAELDFPYRVAVDSKGNYYFADYLTHVIRQVTAAGVISTIAGPGSFGFQGDGGPGIQAIISDVHGLAVDSAGNVYFSDTHNGRVRKITSAGIVSTLAGNGTIGYSGDGGAATSAALSTPAGVAVDSGGNVYIADYGTSTVRKVDSKGNISTIAGTGAWGRGADGGPANKTPLANPFALALDSSGNLYMSDTGTASIRRIAADGTIQTVVSNVDAESLAVDAAGNIYFPNYLNSTVQKVLPNGTRFTIAGTGSPGFSGDGGAATSAQLNQPYGIALGASGTIYVADSNNQVIRLLTPLALSITVVNAASGVGGQIAPGEIVTIYGTGLGPATGTLGQLGADGKFTTQQSGTTVSFGGTNAPIIFTSATQVSAVVPYSMPIGATVDVSVTYQDQTLTATAVPVVASAVGMFTLNASGGGQAAAVNQNNAINDTARPAPLGSVLTVYVSGEGLTTPAGVDGKPATSPLPQPVLAVRALVAGQSVPVVYAGGAPGLIAGLMQVNLALPVNLIQTFATGPVSVPIVIIVGNSITQNNVTVAVLPQ